MPEYVQIVPTKPEPPFFVELAADDGSLNGERGGVRGFYVDRTGRRQDRCQIKQSQIKRTRRAVLDRRLGLVVV